MVTWPIGASSPTTPERSCSSPIIPIHAYAISRLLSIVTERTAYGIVADLTEAGYVVKERDGRRNRYHIQDQLTLRDSVTRERTIGEVLDLLADRPRTPRKGSRARAASNGGRASTPDWSSP